MTNIVAGKPIKGLPSQISVRSSDQAAALHDKLAKAAGCSIHRIRISLGRDGSKAIENDENTVRRAGLNNGMQLFVKDLGM